VIEQERQNREKNDKHLSIFGQSSVAAILKEGYISRKALESLASCNQYSGSDLSFLYNLVLTHYFDWLVKLVPLWVTYVCFQLQH